MTDPWRNHPAFQIASPADWRRRLDAIAASLQVSERPGPTPRTAAGPELVGVDLGVSGEIDGWVLQGGLLDDLAEDEYGWLLDTDVALAQERFLHFAHTRPGEPFDPPAPADELAGRPRFARGTIDAALGAGLRLLSPRRAEDWDGRLWVLTSGTGVYRDLACVYVSADPQPRSGELLPLPAGGFAEGLGANLYAELLLERGAAVAWIRKDEVRPPDGVNRVELEDGSSARVSHHSNLGYTLALIELAQRELARRLGSPPRRTYLYGHSSGAATARLLNLRPASNRRADGGPIVDGLLCDDAAAGMYFPAAFDAEGHDTVLTAAADRDAFVPQIDVSRGLYQPAAYLPVKRENARVLREKGLGDRHRHYEIAAVSHFDAGMADTAGTPAALDLGGVWGALFEAMVALVEEGASAPDSREGEHSLVVPEAAVPLGAWEAPRGGPKTSFAPFDGEEGRETLPEAWRRLGLLDPGEDLDLGRYRARLAGAAEELAGERLFSPTAAEWTIHSAAALLDRSGARL